MESSSEVWQPQFVRNAAKQFADRFDIEVVIIPSLYDSLEGDLPNLVQTQGDNLFQEPFTVFFSWLSPRASRILLCQQGLFASSSAVRDLPIEDLRSWQTVSSGVLDVAKRRNLAPGSGRIVDLTSQEPVSARWRPIIDADRCANCLECLNFCMFGVYNITDGGTITIESPDSCRNGCPACARICPQSAILFPRCTDDRISGWDESDLTVSTLPAQNSQATKPDSALKTGDLLDDIDSLSW